MRRKLLYGVLAAAVVVGSLSLYVALATGGHLARAGIALSDPAAVDEDDLAHAQEQLGLARARLHELPARVLGLVPIARQNLRAVEQVVAEAPRAVDAAVALREALSPLEERGLIDEGAVQVDELRALTADLGRAADAFHDLARRAESARSGWLLPPLWTALDGVAERVRRIADVLRRASEAIALTEELLGVDGERTYLIVLINNAELRGAGGIPSAVGTLGARDGRLRLGRFFHTFDLRGEEPFGRVRAPEEFRRRYGFQGADTTFWVNTTMSPDVADVADVAARLFRRATGVATDGVIVADPRGIAALLPEGATVAVPGTDRVLGRDELPSYVYSDAYAELGARGRRREILLDVGRAAFETFLAGGLRDRAALESAQRAAAGGHIRFIPFDERARRVLAANGIVGEMNPPEADSVSVAVQNMGGDKLDYWIERGVEHACNIDEEVARCAVRVTLTNSVPEGLTRYVAGRPYGRARNLVEIFIPGRADIAGVDRDGAPTRFFPDQMAGYRVVGVMVEMAPGNTVTLDVDYALALGERAYSLELRPQPLARDATLRVGVRAPAGWRLSGAGRISDGVLRFEGAFERTLEMAAAPAGRTGLPALWTRLTRWLREPVL